MTEHVLTPQNNLFGATSEAAIICRRLLYRRTKLPDVLQRKSEYARPISEGGLP